MIFRSGRIREWTHERLTYQLYLWGLFVDDIVILSEVHQVGKCIE